MIPASHSAEQMGRKNLKMNEDYKNSLATSELDDDYSYAMTSMYQNYGFV